MMINKLDMYGIFGRCFGRRIFEKGLGVLEVCLRVLRFDFTFNSSFCDGFYLRTCRGVVR